MKKIKILTCLLGLTLTASALANPTPTHEISRTMETATANSFQAVDQGFLLVVA